MSNSKFTLEQLTEGIRSRNVGAEGNRLMEKWNRTGLLRGLSDHGRENMGRLLENQAAQLLREQNSLSTGGGSLTSSGDIRGFTNIAFPIVRRVFGGLIANELVSIQPMSLPSGLLFYLDYTYGTNVGGGSSLANGTRDTTATTGPDAATFMKGQSIYNQPTGKGIQSGSLAIGGQYDLIGSSYSRVQKTSELPMGSLAVSGAYGAGTAITANLQAFATGSDGKALQFDPQLTTQIEDNLPVLGAGSGGVSAGSKNMQGGFQLLVFNYTETNFPNLTSDNVKSLGLAGGDFASGPARGVATLDAAGWSDTQAGQGLINIRRLNQVGTVSGGIFTPNPMTKNGDSNAAILCVVSGNLSPNAATTANGAASVHQGLTASYALGASLNVNSTDGDTLTIPSFESNFGTNGAGTSPSPIIPEIDIKIESIAVTAATRKLRARWSPELAQDLNAYHSLDAEVELTQILSEQIALELDREILNDLLTQARGANYYWSRMPGKFVNKTNGNEVTSSSSLAAGPSFTGTVREWYETLVETIIDVANEIHRKTLRGSANFIVVSPDIATIFEASVLYKPSLSLDGDGQVATPFTLGATPVGTLSNRFTVYKDPYFPRNKVLVGYKGGSYLETGYVYAPYVPLIVTPTIFAPEDFTPRKGVMTRYGKKMVRADFYGTVTVMDINII